jgi:peptidylamidoglycolate lyase
MKRRIFIKSSAIITTGFAFGAKPEPILGQGNFRYRIDQNWCKADPGAFPVKNCHEMVLDKSGRIFMTTDDTRNNILIFNKDGKVAGAWGHEYPGAHGLTLHDENGEEFLYITDPGLHQVVKTTLEGKVLQTFDWPGDSKLYQTKDEFRPTETAISPSGDVFVADGYGKDYIIHYGPKGELKNIFGGPKYLKNAHGIALDTRNHVAPGWLVSSRADNKLQSFSMDGKLLETTPLPGAYICRPVVKGENVFFAVLISQLPWDSGTGFVCILDKNNKVVSTPAASTPRYDAGGALMPMYQTIRAFKHPHDVLIDRDENLYVAQWNSDQVYPIKLSRV